MAARLGKRLAADDEPRRGREPLLDRLGEREGRAAHVAHRGEAAIEHAAHDRQAAQDRHRIGQLRIGREIHHAGDDMHVAVDQPGHQRAPLEVEHQPVGRRHRPRLKVADDAVLDEDMALARLGTGRIDDAGIGEQGLHGRRG